MFKSRVPDICTTSIWQKYPIFCAFCVVILPTVQNNKQKFCKTWHSLNFNFTLFMKFNLEN